ncbi:glycoside hydrolase family 28 protein [Marinimicrobium agarilyticum]|uniref:glycoside hydrolase family 28 protein n=1 Tax=Marinimicrobium agarilyticum TaxID=306546 RepID=UPI000418A40D|nr:glycoside hydrolase family 28 protein [Marinimicrobium agarilyticum]
MNSSTVRRLTWPLRRLQTLLAAAVLITAGLPAAAQMGPVPQDIAPLNPPFEMPQLKRPTFPNKSFNIRDFGAREMNNDRDNMITDAVHQAIDAAHQAGGGRVVIPAGKWLSGSIHLKSNINLHIAEGAEVLFSTDKDDYLPVVPQRHEGVEAYNYAPMIYASEVENVALTGQGLLNAQGDHWWEWFEEHGAPPRAKMTQVPLSRRGWGKGAGVEGMRPSFIVFWKSKDILVEGVHLLDTPMWNVHLIYSENIIVRDVDINSLRAPNGDGVVVDSSKNVLIEYNHFQTGDDAVVLKSGMNEEALEIDIPSENVVVRHFEAKNVRTGSGGVVFGSETSGGLRNIYVHDAYFDGSDRGIRFKTERGRGNVIENIYIRDVTMKNITYEAINFNSFYTGPEATGVAPTVRNIDIRNVTIDTVPTAISLIGLPEKWLENITLSNIKVTNAEMGARIVRVKNLVMNDVTIESDSLAMTVDDSYEVHFNNVNLSDNVSGGPLRLEGRYTGAIYLNGGISEEDVQLGTGVSEEVINPETPEQAW